MEFELLRFVFFFSFFFLVGGVFNFVIFLRFSLSFNIPPNFKNSFKIEINLFFFFVSFLFEISPVLFCFFLIFSFVFHPFFSLTFAAKWLVIPVFVFVFFLFVSHFFKKRKRESEMENNNNNKKKTTNGVEVKDPEIGESHLLHLKCSGFAKVSQTP